MLESHRLRGSGSTGKLCKEHLGKENNVRKSEVGDNQDVRRNSGIEILLRIEIQNGKKIETEKPAEAGRQLDYMGPYKYFEGLS